MDNEINRIKKENDSMQIQLRFYDFLHFSILKFNIFPFMSLNILIFIRHLKGEDISNLSYKELMVLEEALENGITTLKSKQVLMIMCV